MSLHDRRKAPTLTGPARGGAAVTIDDVTMRFGDRVAASNIRVDVAPGEIVSVVGPSGCGKTTLLRAVAGLLTPSEGSVQVDGETVDGTPEGVGMVFQHFGLFPWKTVEANVAYPLRLRGLPKEEIAARTRELVAMVGLSGFEKSYPHQLSGGMQQRTGLARALAVRPRVLLMDEPFGALDAQTAEVLRFELLRMWEEHPITMLFVTHSIDEAVLFGDRVVVLKGRPGRVHEVIDVALPHPRDRAVARSEQFAALRERVWSLVMSPDAGQAG
ncbi:ABC transporter ATP-binding protein [Herbidospora cretacea]|uniref:ABC transporter ATP-binding protein n=1 Tax=Herbidospora cretacea TaxID=28444 RepID=UPI0009DF0616|nr:ABC transporter ATP-binding protein [Herbidospora cretacea]